MKIKSLSRRLRKLRKKAESKDFSVVLTVVIFLIVIIFPLIIFANLWDDRALITTVDHSANDGFGRSVTTSGATSIYGSPYSEVGAIRDAGAAYVMLASTQQAKLTASDAAEIDYFGFAVALDGDTAAVGAYGADAGGKKDSGAVYIFTRSGTAWSQVAKLTASDATVGDQFGVSLALQSGTLVVGAHQKNSGAGAVYIFTGSGSDWTERKILTGAAGEAFGAAVSLDSSTILVGAPAAGVTTGATYVFIGTGSVWLQQARLTASDGAIGNAFGLHLAVYGDRALIAAEYATVNNKVNVGATYLFKRTLLSWSQVSKITPSDTNEGMQFGSSVALGDSVAVVGAYRDGPSGAVYNFRRDGEDFIQDSKEVPTTVSTNGLFGSAVAVSRDTLKAVIGATNNSAGGAYIYSRAAMVAGLFDSATFDSYTFQ